MTISIASVAAPDVSNAGGQALGIQHANAINALLTRHAGSTSENSTVTPGTPGAGVQDVTIQLKDAFGNNVAGVRRIEVYMCTDTAGATPSAAGSFGAVTATTGVILNTITAKLKFELLTNASGVAVLHFVNTGGGGVYADRLVMLTPGGMPVVSAALAVPTS